LQQEDLRVWFAPEDIEGGKKLHDQIFDAIRVHDKLLSGILFWCLTGVTPAAVHVVSDY
jgi:hypothetical protein